MMDQPIDVSILIPCFNEERTIQKVLYALLAQSYPQERMEVLIADGFSRDQTRQKIQEFVQSHPQLSLRVLDNHAGTIPAGVNLAMREARGQFLIRMDAHSEPNAQYVAQTVALLEAGKADNVGGVWKILPSDSTWAAQSIAAAAAHPFGVGDALYRYATQGQYVDTVPFGGFRKELIDRIGMLDESLLSNEDYEFNTRIRNQGGKIWLEPTIQSNYYARATFGQLAKQYWRYGFWKLQMLRRYPESIRLRQALPPLFVLSLTGLFFLAWFWTPAWWLLAIEAFFYFLVLLGGSLREAVKQKKAFLLLGMPIAIFLMHTVWGSGFLVSALTMIRRR